ncbi:MAG TPA: methyltransferase domain-containing protein [Candidatus Saccharibacteria bacterium]|nr:methyltransferase domain-containing protein [Candidatus Saccharibacteria bacterium]HRK94369.1 methyltransferase domain-containing protein [Candidatus Saccharibacteria bacterium]
MNNPNYDAICLLGRQPELSIAELEQLYGAQNVHPFSNDAVRVQLPADFDIQRIGGTTKSGRIVAEFKHTDWPAASRAIIRYYDKAWATREGKTTLGISVYGQDVAPRDIQRTGLALKQALKKRGQSLRLVPNDAAALSTATSHHNKLGLSDNKVELLVVYGKRSMLVAESTGAQNISALAARDQGRPKRDAFVGMLPPKLALMMVNLSGLPADNAMSSRSGTILDPFCGTGVVLQEAALLGFDVYGTDLAEKMVDYSKANMQWLAQKHPIGQVQIEAGDAIEHRWKSPIDAVVAETYLGQPFSAPPAPDKLQKVVRIVSEITTKFLQNLSAQIEPGTPLCLAVPAWRDANGNFTHLPILHDIEELGYQWQPLEHVDVKHLAYYREDQIVARQLLILRKI